MFQSNKVKDHLHQAFDDEENTLDAGVRLTATATTTTTTGSGKYRRIWRRIIGCVAAKKIRSHDQDSPQPLQSPCPQEPVPIGSKQTQHVIETSSVDCREKKEADEGRNRVIHQESPQPSPSSTIPCAPCPEEPAPIDTKQSQHVIEMTSVDREKKEADEGRNRVIHQESPQLSPSSTIPCAPCPQEPAPIDTKQSQHVIEMTSVDREKKEADEDQKKVAQIVKQNNLNSLKKLGGVDRVARLLGSNLKEGIHGSQDQQVHLIINDKLHLGKGFLYFFLRACNRWTIFLLLVAAGIAFAIDIKEGHGLRNGLQDWVPVLVTVVLLVTFSLVGDLYRERQRAKKVLKNIRKLKVNVVRSGQPRLIDISDVLEGDIVSLKMDDCIPADGLIVQGENLVVDEVFNSKINCDQNPFLFSCSKVVKGHGTMLVTSVGNNTAMGEELSLHMAHDPNYEKTLLQARIEKAIDYGEIFALCVTVLINLVLLIRLLCGKHSNSILSPDLKGNVSVDRLMNIFERISLKSQGNIGNLTSALTTIVIGLQHGMPLVITASLNHWNKKVQINGVELRNSSACGIMGLATIFCIDVTGGWMCKQVEANNFFVGEKDICKGVDSETSQIVVEALHQGIGVSLHVREFTVIPTTNSLSSLLESKCGLNMEDFAQSFEILECTKLSSIKKASGVLMRRNGNDEKIQHLHWCGAASTILEMCSHYYDCGGQTHAMEDKKKKFEEMIKDMEDGGLRPIAFAYKQIEDQGLIEEGLNLLALVGLKYPCQEGIKSMVKELRSAGVCVKLVSGDELSAGRAIACELEIFTPGSNDVALNSEEIRELISSGRMDKLDVVTVIGSCYPKDKLWVIQQLQKEDNPVVFFGGLTTTDTLALKEADVGITVRDWSTECARMSSDIIVQDFGSLLRISNIGRNVNYNIEKLVQLLVTACFSGFITNLIITLFSGASPITGLEMFWVNLILCLTGSQVLLMELKSQHKPAKRTRPLITKAVWGNIAVQVIYQVSVLLIFQFKGETLFSMSDDDVQKTMIFNMYSLCQIFNLFNAIHQVKKEVLLKVIVRSYCFLIILAAVMAAHVLMIEYSGIVTNFVKLNAVQWAFCCIIAALSWGYHLALKWLPHIFEKCYSFVSTSVDSNYGFSNRRRRYYVSHFGVPFSMFLLYASGVFIIVKQYGILPVAL
ncbi:calcium-transporting ATPase 12, plasma membrane-type-like [Corylus avellana]|uniref:calcium-transporting ATPase 12, plasma membrane-type-like n=1 Tax=Corylus avellana TaxID=13451 RepID=UPI001E220E2B|nr:calcium-transporting ATPase 12, plasma membrane-type-like [Corylus avellana]